MQAIMNFLRNQFKCRFQPGAAVLAKLDELSRSLILMELNIMATLTEALANINNIATSIAGLTSDIALLNQKIADLEAAIAAGTPSPELQAAIDAVVAQSAIVSEQAATLDGLTPPAPTV